MRKRRALLFVDYVKWHKYFVGYWLYSLIMCNFACFLDESFLETN